MDLRLEVSEFGGWSVLHVGGEVDVATAPRLRERLIDMIGKDHLTIAVDLTSVDFIDSTGLGVLIGAVKRLRTRGGDLVLVRGDTRVSRVFEITGLDQVFTMVDTTDDLVDS